MMIVLFAGPAYEIRKKKTPAPDVYQIDESCDYIIETGDKIS